MASFTALYVALFCLFFTILFVTWGVIAFRKSWLYFNEISAQHFITSYTNDTQHALVFDICVLIFRSFAVVLAIYIAIFDIIDESFSEYISYFTKWTWTCLAVSWIFETYISAMLLRNPHHEFKRGMLILAWLIYEAMLPATWMVTIVTWTTLCANEEDKREWCFDQVSVIMHICNIIIVTIDYMFFSRLPYHYVNSFIGLLYCDAYLIFANVVYAAGGVYKYSFLETDSSTWPLSYTVLVVVYAIFSGIAYGAIKLRDYMLARIRSNSVSNLIERSVESATSALLDTPQSNYSINFERDTDHGTSDVLDTPQSNYCIN